MGFLINRVVSTVTNVQTRLVSDAMGLVSSCLSVVPQQQDAQSIQCTTGTLIAYHHKEDLGESAGSLNFAAEVLPLGRLRHRRLTWMGNRTFPIANRDQIHRTPQEICSKLRIWRNKTYLSQYKPCIALSARAVVLPTLPTHAGGSTRVWGH